LIGSNGGLGLSENHNEETRESFTNSQSDLNLSALTSIQHHIMVNEVSSAFMGVFTDKYIGTCSPIKPSIKSWIALYVNISVISPMKSKDRIADAIISIVTDSDEPLETKEIEEKLSRETRTRILYRLRNLQGGGLIKGKMVGAGKGTWIWWKRDAFEGGTLSENTRSDGK